MNELDMNERGGRRLVGHLVLMLGLASACFGAREVQDSATVTFSVENRTDEALALAEESWLAIDWRRASLKPLGQVWQLCDVDSPVAAFDSLGLPPPGARVLPGERFEYAWKANAFTDWRCDQGWSDCTECQIAEAVPLGRRQMTICALRTDFACRFDSFTEAITICETLSVSIGDEDQRIEIVLEQAELDAARCENGGELEAL